MKTLAWWFRIVGLIYLALGVTFIPSINSGRVETLVPGFDGAKGGPAWDGFLDYLFMFGLEEIVLGAFLIAVASMRPARYAPLVWLLVAFSMIRGIGHDLYMIASGYSIITNLVFVALHVAIIVSGMIIVRRAARLAPQAPESSNTLIDRATQAL
ncbi:hypothetical protein HDC94_001412 [Leifsonia sp. AK011]|uniref:BphX family protein n=1 Tax=Leifsonia sp. AK011 TaxID=2723075 RepID=UPI0015C7734F|nr:BphX family protein [Leifsonia sp. AK011]NYF10256.1 hypothetical protein [Leifsonia sp. AK011]